MFPTGFELSRVAYDSCCGWMLGAPAMEAQSKLGSLYLVRCVRCFGQCPGLGGFDSYGLHLQFVSWIAAPRPTFAGGSTAPRPAFAGAQRVEAK